MKVEKKQNIYCIFFKSISINSTNLICGSVNVENSYPKRAIMTNLYLAVFQKKKFAYCLYFVAVQNCLIYGPYVKMHSHKYHSNFCEESMAKCDEMIVIVANSILQYNKTEYQAVCYSHIGVYRHKMIPFW